MTSVSGRERQQVLYLWAAGSALDSPTVGWAFHDGTDGAGPDLPRDVRAADVREGDAREGDAREGSPPYDSGVAALRDGWMLLQSAQLVPIATGHEHQNSYLQYEFVFERRATI